MTSGAGWYCTCACAGSTSAQTASVLPTTLERKARIGSFGSAGALVGRGALLPNPHHFSPAHEHLRRNAREITDGENDHDGADAEPAGADRPAALSAPILDIRGGRHVV